MRRGGVNRFSTKDFTVQRDGQQITFVEEDSTLGGWGPAQIYPDAADAGIFLISHKTGRTVRYYLSSTDMNHDEVAGWRFLPVPEDLKKSPGARNTSVLIIND